VTGGKEFEIKGAGDGRNKDPLRTQKRCREASGDTRFEFK
jgi:hypothetical protein